MSIALSAARDQGDADASDGHFPQPPGWGCRKCGEDWPCDPAKDILLAEATWISRTAVLLYLGLCMYDAASDLMRGTEAADLYERFVAWAR